MRLQSAIDHLADYPYLGKLTDKRGVRRVVARPYVIFYRVKKGDVFILDVRHAARDEG